MNRQLRQLAITAHITFSVGWLGAVVAYLALALVGLTNHDPEMARASYRSMDVIGWFVIVPLSLATLLAGLVESLGTPWGVLRHWWVVVKLLLTTGATAILLQHMPTVTQMARAAADLRWVAADHHTVQIQLAVHAGGGLVVLLTTTVLSVYKPWGMTPYGRRLSRQPEAEPVRRSSPPTPVEGFSESHRRSPRWMSVVSYHAIGLAVLALVAHLISGGLPGH